MIYPSDFEQRVGFDQVRELVSEFCYTDAAREMATAEAGGMEFLTAFGQIRERLGQTYEMRNILMLDGDYPGGGYVDINRFLRKIKIEGTYLEPSEMAQLQKGLTLLGDLTSFFRIKAEGKTEEENPYPLLFALAQPLAGFEAVVKEVSRLLDSFGKIRDNASPELAEIRRELQHKSTQIDKRLEAILRQAQASGLVDEDAEISIRDGRGVIPVAAGNKRKLKGLVHDESASGRTAFIEPMEVVELNNEVRELQSAEKREVIRILMQFADAYLRPELENLLFAGEYITRMDFIEAKAKYASSVDATLPALIPGQGVEFKQARHPLLEAALKREGKSIVPLDLRLTAEKYILLISGPNAGGKSVCLKTVGLLQYMLQCGLLVPLKEDSTMGIFDSLFIDIGDQQSLDNDLSTYSSHLQNMKTVLRSANDRSLLLIDEFGSGTEPGMGGAIAESVLQKLEERHVWGVITTHYANLKYYAAGATGIENGAMAFDLQQIQPLFRLEQGRPGSSFAFEIARKIGLPEEIIQSASEKIGSSQANAEKHIREAARDKRYWESKRERIRTAEKNIDRTAAKYEMQLEQIQADRTKILKEAKEEAAQLLAEANRRIEQTIREIREAQAQKEKTRTARAGFDAFREQLDDGAASGEEDPIERKMRQLREREERRAQRKQQKQKEAAEKQTEGKPEKPKELEIGFHVRIKGQGMIGQVMSISGKKAAVAFNHMTTSVDKDRLEIVPHSEVKKLKKQTESFTGVYAKQTSDGYDSSKKRLNFKRQVDLRGMRAVDALAEVETYIDEAVMLGIPEVKILHGKGTGALKEEIRRYLRTIPLVESAEDEHEEFGGAGITVVTLDV